jgi:hypothetical protein
MVIYRLAPGQIAPWDATYKLVADYGEQVGRTVTAKRGERLPLVAADDDSEFWFVLADEPGEVANAA